MSAVNRYDPGDTVRIKATLTDKTTGLAIDPTALVCYVRDPAGVQTAYSWPSGSPAISRTATGAFKVEHPVPAKNASSGDWSYFWSATGAVVAGEAGAFNVRATSVVLP